MPTVVRSRPLKGTSKDFEVASARQRAVRDRARQRLISGYESRPAPDSSTRKIVGTTVFRGSLNGARLLLLALAGLFVAEGCAMSPSPPSTELLAAAAAPVRLEHMPVTVALAPAGADLAAKVAALAPGHEVYLLLDGLRVIGDPGSLYQVELIAADARPPARIVGSFNVFGVAHAEGATAQRSFVVTAALRELAGSGALSVRLSPDPAAAPDARVEIGRISLLVQ